MTTNPNPTMTGRHAIERAIKNAEYLARRTNDAGYTEEADALRRLLAFLPQPSMLRFVASAIPGGGRASAARLAIASLNHAAHGSTTTTGQTAER